MTIISFVLYQTNFHAAIVIDSCPLLGLSLPDQSTRALRTDVLQIHFEILTSFNCQLFPMSWSTVIVKFSQGAGQL